MSNRSFLALAVLATLTGCASTTAQPVSTPLVVGKGQQLESFKADCMKQQGFKYVAYVQHLSYANTEEDRRRRAGDYSAMLKYRQKNGFGIFSRLVYPEAIAPPEPNPNDAIVSRLSPDQADAYVDARTSCFSKAAKQVLGRNLKSENDYFEQADRRSQQLMTGRLDSDPELVELASGMADCLKAKGYAVDRTTPSAMQHRGVLLFMKEKNRLRPASPAKAKPHLAREIKAALDDLECGKTYYPAFNPKERAISAKVDEEFGMVE